MKLYVWYETDYGSGTYNSVAVVANNVEEARTAAIAAYRAQNTRSVYIHSYPEHYDYDPDVEEVVEGRPVAVYIG
jgi:hypothetical protein